MGTLKGSTSRWIRDDGTVLENRCMFLLFKTPRIGSTVLENWYSSKPQEASSPSFFPVTLPTTSLYACRIQRKQRCSDYYSADRFLLHVSSMVPWSTVDNDKPKRMKRKRRSHMPYPSFLDEEELNRDPKRRFRRTVQLPS